MKIKILLALLLFTLLSKAQTKVIAHKSHSGSNSSFSKAYQNNLFDMNYSNFGLPEVRILQLDTVIAVNKSITILKFRQSKTKYHIGTKSEDIKKSDFIYRTDTLINDPILNKKNTLEFIKSSKTTFLNTSINEIVFIGFKKSK